jgi:hypothetical protein
MCAGGLAGAPKTWTGLTYAVLHGCCICRWHVRRQFGRCSQNADWTDLRGFTRMLPLSVVCAPAVLSVFPKRRPGWSSRFYAYVAFAGGIGGGGFVGVLKTRIGLIYAVLHECCLCRWYVRRQFGRCSQNADRAGLRWFTRMLPLSVVWAPSVWPVSPKRGPGDLRGFTLMLPLSVVWASAVLSVFPKRGLGWPTRFYAYVAFVGGMGAVGLAGVPKTRTGLTYAGLRVCCLCR